jgi:hypothetical protein
MANKPFYGYEPAPSDVEHAKARGVEVGTQDFSHLEQTDSEKVAAEATSVEAQKAEASDEEFEVNEEDEEADDGE